MTDPLFAPPSRSGKALAAPRLTIGVDGPPMTDDFVVARLKAIVVESMAAGKHSTANRALELLGRHLGMFRADDGEAPGETIEDAILRLAALDDVPPDQGPADAFGWEDVP